MRDRLRGDPGFELHVRIGVATGEALVDLRADPLAGEGVASGDVVNTAARIQTACPVDGVLVGEATYRATNRAVEYVKVDPIDAKGKRAPVPVWVAQRLIPRAAGGSGADAIPLVVEDDPERAVRAALAILMALFGAPLVQRNDTAARFRAHPRRPESA